MIQKFSEEKLDLVLGILYLKLSKDVSIIGLPDIRPKKNYVSSIYRNYTLVEVLLEYSSNYLFLYYKDNL